MRFVLKSSISLTGRGHLDSNVESKLAPVRQGWMDSAIAGAEMGTPKIERESETKPQPLVV